MKYKTKITGRFRERGFIVASEEKKSDGLDIFDICYERPMHINSVFDGVREKGWNSSKKRCPTWCPEVV